MSSKSLAGSKGKAHTPSESSRLTLTNPLSDGTKKRVREIDSNGNKCLVENFSEERAVDFAHVCSKSFASREDEMDSVEWYWNMAHQTLNLDTRWNIIRLGSSVHRLFDKSSWILIPEESIVDKYHNSLVRNGKRFVAIRERFPEIENRDDFKYTFLPIDHRIMPKITLLRQNDPPKNDPSPLPKPLTSNDFVIHTYPFNNMPVLKSHVHPKFVILESGLAITKVSPTSGYLLFNEYPILAKMNDIYEAWKAPRPDDWMEDPTYNLPSPDPDNQGSDRDSEYTERARTKPQNRRQHRDVPQTPTPAPQTRCAFDSDTQGSRRVSKLVTSVCLSKKSLELHDSTVGMGNWTNEAVQKWSAKCRPLPCTVAARTSWV